MTPPVPVNLAPTEPIATRGREEMPNLLGGADFGAVLGTVAYSVVVEGILPGCGRPSACKWRTEEGLCGVVGFGRTGIDGRRATCCLRPQSRRRARRGLRLMNEFNLKPSKEGRNRHARE